MQRVSLLPLRTSTPFLNPPPIHIIKQHNKTEVVVAMREVGIDVSGKVPQKLTSELIVSNGVKLVFTMGCGDKCPYGAFNTRLFARALCKSFRWLCSFFCDGVLCVGNKTQPVANTTKPSVTKHTPSLSFSQLDSPRRGGCRLEDPRPPRPERRRRQGDPRRHQAEGAGAGGGEGVEAQGRGGGGGGGGGCVKETTTGPAADVAVLPRACERCVSDAVTLHLSCITLRECAASKREGTSAKKDYQNTPL